MNKFYQPTLDEEVKIKPYSKLISTTDKFGRIKYANPDFCKVSEYSLEELVGKNHNIVRHPDMPKEAFHDMWKSLKRGQAWRGAVENRSKSGRFYWVDVFVTPIFESGDIV